MLPLHSVLAEGVALTPVGVVFTTSAEEVVTVVLPQALVATRV